MSNLINSGELPIEAGRIKCLSTFSEEVQNVFTKHRMLLMRLNNCDQIGGRGQHQNNRMPPLLGNVYIETYNLSQL